MRREDDSPAPIGELIGIPFPKSPKNFPITSTIGVRNRGRPLLRGCPAVRFALSPNTRESCPALSRDTGHRADGLHESASSVLPRPGSATPERCVSVRRLPPDPHSTLHGAGPGGRPAPAPVHRLRGQGSRTGRKPVQSPSFDPSPAAHLQYSAPERTEAKGRSAAGSMPIPAVLEAGNPAATA